ncbi:hypothetical protein [Bacillus piscicola]|uniref:hypothetical protein n=1 Tax=Bacillus piscicola TaxID=1632684 RepID=UPI001F08CE45|nr:hypothetical protein [Bacillus piscicola]
MGSWFALVRKEFLLTRLIFFAALGFIFLVWVFSYVIDSLNTIDDAFTWEVNAHRFAGPAMLSLMTAGVILHILYMPVYLIISMQKEANTLQWWLHSPQPMWKLLTAKLTSGLFCMICSLCINAGIVLFVMFRSLRGEIASLDLLPLAVRGGLFVVGMSVYFSLYILLFVAIYLTLRGQIGKWSWLVVIGLFILLNVASERIAGSGWFQALTHWGGFAIFKDFSFGFPEAFFGTIVFHAIWGVVLFWVSTVLIERRAEV